MSIHYEIEQREKYLYFIGRGVETDLKENKKIHQMILDACKKYGCSRVLIDDRQVTYTASILSIYELAEHYKATISASIVWRVAVIVPPEDQGGNTFFENVSRNRGINLRVFYNFEEAETWLIHENRSGQK